MFKYNNCKDTNIQELLDLTLHTLQAFALYRFQVGMYPAQIRAQPCITQFQRFPEKISFMKQKGTGSILEDEGYSIPAGKTNIDFIYPLYFGYHISNFNRYYK